MKLVPREAQRAHEEVRKLAGFDQPRNITRRAACAKAGIAAAAFCALGISGCGSTTSELPEPEPIDMRKFEKPSRTGTAFFGQEYVGLGEVNLGVQDMPYLAHWPTFSIYNGHAGGIGDTFEVISTEYGMYFRFAYDSLFDIKLSGNWQGTIAENGLKLGDSIEKFLTAYPQAKQSKANPNKYWYIMDIPKPLHYTVDQAAIIVEKDALGKIISIVLSGAGEANWGTDLGSYEFID